MAITFGVLADLHKGDEVDGGGVGDAGGKRVYSTATKRFDGFLLAMNRFGVDFNIQLGDLVDNGDSDHGNTFDALITKFAADSDIDAWNVFGNHENALMTITEWRDYVATEHAANTVAIENLWQTAATYTAYTFDIGEFRFIVLNTYAGTEFDDDPIGRTDELSWLEDTALNTALPIIVFSHQHLEKITAMAMSDADCDAIHTLFTANGNVKAVISGHQHGGGRATNDASHIFPILWDGIPHYSLKGSILGTRLGDYSSNHYYIFEVETSGQIRVLEYEKPAFGRLRQSTGLLDDSLSRGRSRYDI